MRRAATSLACLQAAFRESEDVEEVVTRESAS